MKFTLAINSQTFLSNKKILSEIDQALKFCIFDRIQISLRTANGIDLLSNNEKLIFEVLDIVKKHRVQFVASIATYQDYSNKDIDICVREARTYKSKIIPNRICPSNKFFQHNMLKYLEKTFNSIFKSIDGLVHLSYYRFENFNQCVCDDCVRNFNLYRIEQQKAEIMLKSYKSLLKKDVAKDWVSWRRCLLLKNIEEMKKNFLGKLSIEIDWDKSKRYLGGAEVEDGLGFEQLIRKVEEMYLHIEPTDPYFSLVKYENGRQDSGYLNYLHYISSLAASNNTICSYFFWALQDKKRIERNLPEYFKLSSLSDIDSVILYTKVPLVLARTLNDIL